MIYRETDPRALAILGRALESTSATTRVRAVAMLACAECAPRMAWLEKAALDGSRMVRDTALTVLAWVTPVAEPPWPEREDTPSGAEEPDALAACGDPTAGARREWEYVVEVWREDALLVGVFLSTVNDEDDEHAKCIALGQAVLASVQPGQDAFEPSSAAAFVGKRHVIRRSSARRGGSSRF